MKQPKYFFFVILCMGTFRGFAQFGTDTLLAKDNVLIPLPMVSINFGIGNLMSDVKLSSGPSPFKQFGYQLTITQPITKFLNASFELYGGTVYGEEQRDLTNLNFKTSLFSQRLSIEYNFYPLLKPNERSMQLIRPYVGFGVGLLSFRSKGDLKTSNGSTYHYWSNGSIYAENEGTVDVSEATLVERDFVYETDLRDANLDGLKKYSQLAFSLPINAGIRFQITKNIGLNAAFAYALNFSDMLDNVSVDGAGNRAGKSGNDNHLFGSLGLTVYLGTTKPSAKPKKATPEELAAAAKAKADAKRAEQKAAKEKAAILVAANSDQQTETQSGEDADTVGNHADESILIDSESVDESGAETVNLKSSDINGDVSATVDNKKLDAKNESALDGSSGENSDSNKDLKRKDATGNTIDVNTGVQAVSNSNSTVASTSATNNKGEVNSSVTGVGGTVATGTLDALVTKGQKEDNETSKASTSKTSPTTDGLKSGETTGSNTNGEIDTESGKSPRSETNSLAVNQSKETSAQTGNPTSKNAETAPKESSNGSGTTSSSDENAIANSAGSETNKDNASKEGQASNAANRKESEMVKTDKPSGNDSSPLAAINKIENSQPKKTGKFHWADLNDDGMISPTEVLHFIDLLFEGESARTVEDIQFLIDYYFDQE